MYSIKKLVAVGLLCLPALAGTAVAADTYPAKPIRWIVPYAAGGGSDFLARSIGQSLSARMDQPVLIENKPGGGTAIGASETARAQPDGYTMMSADNGTLVFNQVLYKNLTYSPEKDLAPVTLLGRFPMILVAGPGANYKDAKDFIDQVKARKTGVNYGSAGAGSPHHLAMELLRKEAGLDMVHVPYRGASPALTDVAGGQIPVMMVDLAAGNAFIKAGKVKALAVANAKRLPQLPDVPTFAEIGLPTVEASAQVGVVVPAATPTERIDRLNRDLVASIREPAVRDKLIEFGIEPVGNTPAQYADMLQAERKRWHALIRDLNIALD